jgi:hypothetical protein
MTSIRCALVLALLAGSAPAAAEAGAGTATPQSSQQPIVGRWLGQYFKGIDFRQAADGSFIGSVEPGGTGPCETSAGIDKSGGPDHYFSASGSALHYTGLERWISLSDCSLFGSGEGQTTYDINLAHPSQPTIQICSAPPGSGPPTPGQGATECNTLTWSPQQWAAPQIANPPLITLSGGHMPIGCPRLSRPCQGTVSAVWHHRTLVTGRFSVAPGSTASVRLRLTRAGLAHLRKEPQPHRMRVTYIISQAGLGTQSIAGILECNSRSGRA